MQQTTFLVLVQNLVATLLNSDIRGYLCVCYLFFVKDQVKENT